MNDNIWYKMDIKSIATELDTNIIDGLDNQQVKKRLEKFGKNELKEDEGETLFKKFINQFKNFMVIILLIAALLSGFLGELKDTIIIFIIVSLNAILGLIQENKAEESLKALKNLSKPSAKVLRNGGTVEIKSTEIVPGDIVLLEAGDYVPADGRIIEGASLKIEESALTGESLPVEKQINIPDGENIPLGDRKNMVYQASTVNYGRGKIIVTGTGMKTEIGRIAEMLKSQEKIKTPLQNKLEELGKWLGVFALIICTIIFFIGYFQGRPPLEMFMLAVSLAVAAIPEGLPAIVTIVLSLGVQRMIKRNAIIRRLPAVETLGTASVICSDKTGTLTQNKMTVTKIYKYDKVIEKEKINVQNNIEKKIIDIGLLCNDASIEERDGEKNSIGDPTEVALVMLAQEKGFFKKELEEKFNRIDEIPFDSERKLMSTINKKNDCYSVFTKGAPDILIDRCDKILINSGVEKLTQEIRKTIKNINSNFAQKALRVLAVAYKDISELPKEIVSETIENNLVFVGLVGMIDPPRKEVKMAVEKCKNAGIKPVMITGDYKLTAITIAKELGIMDEYSIGIEGKELENMVEDELKNNIEKYSVFARVSPEHKVKIVKAWQENGRIVAMTGDGVNDAPSLKRANIGCAMGISGTDVSKEASDMILTDDNFATIVAAVEEGRSIFDNIKKSIHYLLSCNIGEIVALFIALILNMPSPLLPIHILWVNLVTDSFPALALGVEPPEKDIMKRNPRDPNKSIFSDGLGISIIIKGIIIGLIALLAFNIGKVYSLKIGRTMAFFTLSFSQFGNSLSVRSIDKNIFNIGIFTNKYLIGGILISSTLMLGTLIFPFLRYAFDLSVLSLNQWIYIFILSIIPLILGELFKVIRGKYKNKIIKMIE